MRLRGKSSARALEWVLSQYADMQERMRKEHPMSERDTVIRNGRVQGGLQPTRAFGDAVYKWTNAQAAQYVAAYIRIVYFLFFFG